MEVRMYRTKQRWKWWLGFSAAFIVLLVSAYTGYLVKFVANEEKQKVELWGKAIQKRAELIRKTKKMFRRFEEEDKQNIDLWVKALQCLVSGCSDELAATIVGSNNTIPVILVDEEGTVITHNHFQEETDLKAEVERLKERKRFVDASYVVNGVSKKQTAYFDDSIIFSELKGTIDDLLSNFISETVINAASVPVIITTLKEDSLIGSGNLQPAGIENNWSAKQVIQRMREFNHMQVELDDGVSYHIYYQDSLIVSSLTYFPFVLFTVIFLFVLVAYLLFSTARRVEQNQVWVGMSKETAHQLGTPLSSLMGWIELFKSRGIEVEAVKEMERDVNRLDTVAQRFSKIGSQPDLKPVELIPMVRDMVSYMQARSRKNIKISAEILCESARIEGNLPLLEWVLENLIRNSLDAMPEAGEIRLVLEKAGPNLQLDVWDSGKGIPRKLWKTIFKPGFTTKQRGWGLGLSLTKRIVENYHKGRIGVQASEPDKGTCIRIAFSSID